VGADMRDLFEDRFGWQPLLHQARHDMLEHKPKDPTHHDKGVKGYEQRRHRSAQPKTAVQENKRSCQEGEPDMGAQPSLHGPYSPKRDFFSKIEKRRENKNSERDGAKGQSERRAAHGVVLGRSLDQ